MCRTIPHFLTFKSCPGQNISITPLKNTLNVVTAMYLYPLNIFQSFSCFVLEDLTLISTFFALPFSLGFCNIPHSLFLSYLSWRLLFLSHATSDSLGKPRMGPLLAVSIVSTLVQVSSVSHLEYWNSFLLGPCSWFWHPTHSPFYSQRSNWSKSA